MTAGMEAKAIRKINFASYCLEDNRIDGGDTI